MKRLWIFLPSLVLLDLGIFVAAPAKTTLGQKPAKPAGQPQPAVPIATGRYRISRGIQAARIFQGSLKISVDYFTELVIARLTDDRADPEKLTGVTISLSRNMKGGRQWDVFRGGASDGDALALPENVFRIYKVLSSRVDAPVKVQLDGQIYRLEPGEILLLLG